MNDEDKRLYRLGLIEMDEHEEEMAEPEEDISDSRPPWGTGRGVWSTGLPDRPQNPYNEEE